MGETKYKSVAEIKALRVQADALLQAIQAEGTHSAEEVFTANGQQDLYHTGAYQAELAAMLAKMWCGKMLEGLGNPFPAELADKSTGATTQAPGTGAISSNNGTGAQG